MKKLLLTLFLLFSCSLFSSIYAVEVNITEFGYPLVPDASQIDIKIPIKEFKIKTWYRAMSPYFVPNVYFEVGVNGYINLVKPEKIKLYVGLGTAYSQANGVYSIPLIIPFEFIFSPTNFIDLNGDLQTMVYWEGLLSELSVSVVFKIPKVPISLRAGGTANIAYSWKNKHFDHSYGIMFAIGLYL